MGLGLLLGACGTPGAALKPGTEAYNDTARRAYYEGMRNLMAKDYTRASEIFQVVATSPRHVKHGSLAKLRLGDTMFEQARFAEAAEIYRSFVMQHPSDPNLPYARFRVAECQYNRIPSEWFATPPAYAFDQTLTQHAEAELRSFLNAFPTHDLTPRAQQMLKKVRTMLLKHELFIADFYASKSKWKASSARIRFALDQFPELTRENDSLAWRYVETTAKMKTEPVLQAQALSYYIERFPSGSHLDAASRRLQELRPQLPVELPGVQRPAPFYP